MRPTRVVAVVGTGTEVGKTWVACELLGAARARGMRVQARKPVQSFAVDHVVEDASTDAGLLAAVTGEALHRVCPAHRWYPRAMAPPMAADALGMPPFTAADLLRETTWSEPADLALVETVGGLRSPMSNDADSIGFVRALGPDVVVLVADAGLGTINAVRLAADALAGLAFTVLLNRFDGSDELHRRNRTWLAARDGFAVYVDARAPELVDAPR